jgi:hypothetical protein
VDFLIENKICKFFPKLLVNGLMTLGLPEATVSRNPFLLHSKNNK